jgi:hypothetical protein
MPTETRKKKVSYGGCVADWVGPARLNTAHTAVHLSFEEALKLKAALDEGVRRLNSYDQRTREAKRAGLWVVIYHGPGQRGRLTIGPAKLPIQPVTMPQRDISVVGDDKQIEPLST